MKPELRVATCQFPVSENIDKNLEYIGRYIQAAAVNGADIIHFPECALSGYGSPVIPCLDWEALTLGFQKVQSLAKEQGIQVLLGSYHRESEAGIPFNSVHVISNSGESVGRYDKRKLYGKEKRLGLCHPGHRSMTFTLNGMTCGVLICYDSCFPSLYRELRDQGVKLLFHSFYNAGNEGYADSLDDLILAQLRTRAADNHMWISASNSCLRHSRLASCFARPDGSVRSLKRHVAGILCHYFPDNALGWTYDNREGR